MFIYSIIMFFVTVLFVGIGIAIYCGKTELIHDYHRTKVTDNAAYGRAFGKAMLTFAVGFLVSGIVGLFGDTDGIAIAASTVLILALIIGTIRILFVQKKYNGGLF